MPDPRDWEAMSRSPPIHYATAFPVRQTPCGTVGPATHVIGYVTCDPCLAAMHQTTEVVARRAELEQELQP